MAKSDGQDQEQRVQQARIAARETEVQQARDAGLTAILPAMERSLARLQDRASR